MYILLSSHEAFSNLILQHSHHYWSQVLIFLNILTHWKLDLLRGHSNNMWHFWRGPGQSDKLFKFWCKGILLKACFWTYFDKFGIVRNNRGMKMCIQLFPNHQFRLRKPFYNARGMNLLHISNNFTFCSWDPQIAF